MGIADMFNVGKGKSIDEYVREAQANAKAVIVDVRSADEFAKGHIKGAVNVPLNQIAKIGDVVADKSTPVYLHCLSGSRSAKALAFMQKSGYANVVNMGGINLYGGALEGPGGGGAGGGGGAR